MFVTNIVNHIFLIFTTHVILIRWLGSTRNLVIYLATNISLKGIILKLQKDSVLIEMSTEDFQRFSTERIRYVLRE